MNVYLTTLGCRLNEAETTAWTQGFQAQGHRLATQAETADIIIVNTCAVTEEAVKKSRKLIRRTQRHNPTAKLVVSGCYMSLPKTSQPPLAGVDLVIDNQHKDQLVATVLAKFNIKPEPLIPNNGLAASIFARGRQRAFVKIQDGCRYRCRFCIVTIARGTERSRASASIIAHINQLKEQGLREVVLTGVHIGGYGSDNGSSLAQLVKSILAETDIERIRFGSLEPWAVNDELLTLFSDKRLLPHLHLPLQSGSDSTLKSMARRGSTKDFMSLIHKARTYIANFNVTTDIIAGYPGETELAWQESYRFIEAVGFSRLHIFPYSKRHGTRAASLTGQVPAAIIKARCRQLQELSGLLQQKFLKTQIGKTYQVLWEKVNTDGHWVGYSDNFIHANLADAPATPLTNKISTVNIIAVNKQHNGCLVTIP